MIYAGNPLQENAVVDSIVKPKQTKHRRQQDDHDGLILRDQMKFGLPINALSSICFSSWDIPYTSVTVVGFSMDLLYMKSNERISLGDPFLSMGTFFKVKVQNGRQHPSKNIRIERFHVQNCTLCAFEFFGGWGFYYGMRGVIWA